MRAYFIDTKHNYRLPLSEPSPPLPTLGGKAVRRVTFRNMPVTDSQASSTVGLGQPLRRFSTHPSPQGSLLALLLGLGKGGGGGVGGGCQEAAMKGFEAELAGSAYNVTSSPAQHFCWCVFHLLVLQLEASPSTLTPGPYPVNGSNFVEQEALVYQTVFFTPGLASDRIYPLEL